MRKLLDWVPEQERVRDSEKQTGTQMRCKKTVGYCIQNIPERSMLVIQVS